MKQKIKSLQMIYVAILLVAIFELVLVPQEYVGDEPKVLYWINLYGIVTALGGMFFALRLFAFKKIKMQICQEDEKKAIDAFLSYTRWRLGGLALALWSNVVLYEASSYTSTPKYAILIILVTFVFCWPSRSEYLSVRSKD